MQKGQYAQLLVTIDSGDTHLSILSAKMSVHGNVGYW